MCRRKWNQVIATQHILSDFEWRARRKRNVKKSTNFETSNCFILEHSQHVSLQNKSHTLTRWHFNSLHSTLYLTLLLWQPFKKSSMQKYVEWSTLEMNGFMTWWCLKHEIELRNPTLTGFTEFFSISSSPLLLLDINYIYLSISFRLAGNCYRNNFNYTIPNVSLMNTRNSTARLSADYRLPTKDHLFFFANVHKLSSQRFRL